jgi:hypothetical protein
VLLSKFYSGGQLEKNVMDGACSRYERQKWRVQDFVWETREKELREILMRKWEDNIKMHLQELG